MTHPEATPPATIEFLAANLALPLPLQLAGSVSDYEHYVAAIGADGLEVTPGYSRFMTRALERADMLGCLPWDPAAFSPTAQLGRLLTRESVFDMCGLDRRYDWSYEDAALHQLIRSGHASFRKQTGDNGLTARFFPRWRESLDRLQRLQWVAGPLAVVLYAGSGYDESFDDTSAPFAERSLQPTAADWAHLGLQEDAPVEEVRGVLKRRGFDGLTWDVFHCQDFRDPLALCARLSAEGLIGSVHLSVGRVDRTPKYSPQARQTARARQAFIHSPEAAATTMEGELLQLIAHDWHASPLHTSKRRRIVLEETPRINLVAAAHEQAAIIENTRVFVAGRA